MQPLEARLLLAATPAAAADLKHGPLAKVGAGLAAVYQDFAAHLARGNPAASFHASDRLLHSAGDRVAIEAYTTGDSGVLEAQLRTIGGSDLHRFNNVVAGLIPYGKIAALAALDSLSFARPLWYRTRTVTSQGDASVRADVARSTYGFTGSGIKVGVLSDSFDTGPGSYSADIASGDLPAGVQVLQDSASGTDEGRAMAQLVYDSAPGASLAFATAFVGGQTGFANNIKALRDAGAKVIVDDIIYFAEPMFQDGVIAQAVDNVVASGVSYFSAAGNEGRQAYESAFRSGITRTDGSISGGGARHFYGGLTHDFDPGPGVDDMQSFTLAPNESITLSFQWDQPYGTIPGSASPTNDLDIYVLNEAGTSVVASAATNNSGAGRDPIEILSFTNGAQTKTYNLMISRFAGTSPTLIKYINFDTQNFTQFNTNSGAVFGHSNAAGAAAVGAAAWFETPAFGVNPPLLESYSSGGKTPILFNTAGARLASPVNRQRPQFVAPDGGNTTFFYSDSVSDSDTLPNFFGTSAAAPAAAAVAALLLQAKPSLTPAQVYTTMQNSALDMGVAGVDDDTGYGFVRADFAVASVLPGSVSGQAFQDFNANGALDAGETAVAGATVFDDANSNGSADPGEPSATSAASGTYTVSGLSLGSHTLRAIAPAGFALTTATQVVNVAGAVTGVNFANVATVYTGSAGADNYLLRRKLGDATKLEILIGGLLSYTVPIAAVPSLTFNLLGGDDSLTVDAANGVPIPGGGVTFAGGANADRLIVLGTSGADAATFAAGSATFAGAIVSHSGVENATFDGRGGFDTFTANAGNVLLTAAQQFQSLTIAGLASVAIAAGGGGGNATVTRVLAINDNGVLDLADNNLAIDYSAAAATPLGTWNGSAYTGITGMIARGYNFSAWDGSGLVTTTSAARSGLTTLAAAEAADVSSLSGNETTTWNGQSIDATTVIVKYTYAGDGNLNGTIDGGDYGIVDNFAQVPGASAYFNGDFNYDGVVDGGDYGIIDNNITAQGAPL